MKKLIVGASLGNCVHVAGVINFLKLAETKGYSTVFLGPAVSINNLLNAVEETDPQIIAVSYRLSPSTGKRLFKKLKKAVQERGMEKYQFLFGGTPPVAREANKINFFSKVFTGKESTKDVILFLEGKNRNKSFIIKPKNKLLTRLKDNYPYPLIRHHFGLPSLTHTINGIKNISKSEMIDIISIAPDQVTQQSFFRPEEIDHKNDGAGGAPIRKKDDLNQIYQASRCGNFPLLRCYSGTQDVFKMAKLLLETINNAWTAIPLCWYNKLDRRGPRPLKESINENTRLIAWHAQRGIPVEVNEAHHWSLRDAHDTIAVTAAYLAAYNAKARGVNYYIAQYMFNTPPATYGSMDLAKMLAKKELIEQLAANNFQVITQTRAGLASFPNNLEQARGQLGYSTFLQMALKPDIVHVVGYTEANHAARPYEVINSCRLTRQIINKLTEDFPFTLEEDKIKQRKEKLISESKILLSAIKNLGPGNKKENLSKPEILTNAIKTGLLDAPHLRGNPSAAGKLTTKIINGACYAYDFKHNQILNEKNRISQLKEL